MNDAAGRKRPPRPEQEAFVAVLRTANALEQGLAALLKGHELTPTQYNALRILRGAGPEGLMCSEIAERMLTRDPDVTRLLDRLERRGLTVRLRPAEDRRAVHAALTDAGKLLLAPLDGPVAELHQRQLGHLPPEDLRRLTELLERARRRKA